MHQHEGLPVVIVPDGLEVEFLSGKKIIHPSQIYKSVLDFVLKEFKCSNILLAPANHFGTGKYEEDVAFQYCKTQNPNIKSLYKPNRPDKNGYIDTRGNARELRDALVLDDMWPETGIILVSAELHSRRALICFKKEGFHVSESIAVKCASTNKFKLVNRLWYYRYPVIHRLYEMLATILDLLRPRRGFE